MNRKKLSVLQVYASVMEEARKWEEEAGRLSLEHERNPEIHVCMGISRELYRVATMLENTAEVNPYKNNPDVCLHDITQRWDNICADCGERGEEVLH
jgi:hypothetical protein